MFLSLWKKACRLGLRQYAKVGAVYFRSEEKRAEFRDKIDDIIISLHKDEINSFIKRYPRVLSEEETLDLLLKERKSICRFGDGEFKLLAGEKHKSFQDVSEQLNKRMLEVLHSKNPDILVAIHPVRSFDALGRIWQKFIIRIGEDVLSFLDSGLEYPSMGVFRTLPKKDKERFDRHVKNIKKLWDKRNVLFVVGKNSRFEFVPELFENVQSADYVYAPAKNAFNEYDTVLKLVKKYDPDDYLILLVLGPTATVMAYDLALAGYQAIDFGQMPGAYLKRKELFSKRQVGA